MGHKFSHLQKRDRYKIEALLNTGHKPQEIADEIHVHVSTIYREIQRARMVQLTTDLEEVDKYNPDEAEKRYRENLSAKGPALKIGKDFETSICVSTLYSYIEKGVFLTLTNADLPEKPKRKRKYRKVREAKSAAAGDSIDRRPPEVDDRNTFGHWEGDTVYSKKDGSKALLVLTERLTRREIIMRIKDRTAESVIKALDRIERKFGADLFAKLFQTITFDNGKEFSDVERLERSALRKGKKRTKVYFCHPYSSFERGSNECQNKMIRRRFPKGTDFGKVSDAEVAKAEAWVNNYPREILGWQTSEILFQAYLAALVTAPK